MATVNLGQIKPVFKGAYNNSTAYVLDNIVTSGGSSYICILASTGNAVSNGTYWSTLAAGTGDASDLSSGTLPIARIADDAIVEAKIGPAAVVTAAINDDAVTTAKINANAVGLTELAGIARGKLIYGDSGGDPAVLSPGSANQVLTSDGTDISWAAAAAGGKLLQVVKGGISSVSTHAAGGDVYETVYNVSMSNVVSTSTILGFVMWQGYISTSGSDFSAFVFRGSTSIGGGTAADSAASALIVNRREADANTSFHANGQFADTGHGGGSLTYAFKIMNEGTIYMGRPSQSGATRHGRGQNNMILMEIGA